MHWTAVLAWIAVAGVAILRLRDWRGASLILVGIAAIALGLALHRSSNNRPWLPDVARLALAQFQTDTVVVHNVRHAVYRAMDDYDVAWETRRYDLGKIRTVDFLVEPFGEWRGLAHTLLTFGFDWRIVLPGYLDGLAWKLGLIDFDGTLAEARKHLLINKDAAFDDSLDGPGWSARIRSGRTQRREGAEGSTWPEAAQQLIVSLAPDWDSVRGVLQCFERTEDGGGWIPVSGVMPALYGSQGLAWGRGVLGQDEGGLRKVEGDRRAPAGVFTLGRIYGSDPGLPAGADFPYRQVTAADAWIDDPDHPLYNRHYVAELDDPPDWFEKHRMRLDDPAFRWMIEVRHNAEPPVPGAGSAIFLHIRRGTDRPTAGCTALAEEDLAWIVRWLRADRSPHFVLLPRGDYLRMWTPWNLPPPEAVTALLER